MKCYFLGKINMPEDINDLTTINKLIDNLFSVLPIYMLINNKPVNVKIVTNTDKGLIVRVPTEVVTEPGTDKRILTITNAGNLYIFLFSIVGSQNGYEILKPLKVSMKTASRSSERISLDDQAQSSLFKLFLTNIINQSKINESLNSNSAKVAAIIKANLPKLKAKYADANIYIQDRPDTRLRLLTNYDCPIYIPDMTVPSSNDERFVPYKEIKDLLKPSRAVDKIRSEIAIPLKYRNYSYIGYILVNDTEAMTPEDLDFVNQVALTVQREVYLANIVLESKEICLLHDLSKKGLSFLHPPTKISNKIFESNGTIIFDLVLSETEKHTLRAIIRNIKPMEKEYRIGCEFHPQSQEELHPLDEFLNNQAVSSVQKNKQAEVAPPQTE
jgi:hypothetical protein